MPPEVTQDRMGHPVHSLFNHPDTGQSLLTLTLESDGPVLRLFDYQGVEAVKLCACRHSGAAVEVSNAEGDFVAYLADCDDGGAVGVAGKRVPRKGDPMNESNRDRVLLTADPERGRIQLLHSTPEDPLEDEFATVTVAPGGRLVIG